MFDRAKFFGIVRGSIFGGHLDQGQVDGMTRILDYWANKYPQLRLPEIAYILATIFHETGGAMQPVTENGSTAYLRSKPYWPYIGRGLVQITWVANYRRFGVNKPEDALLWPVALDIAFRGMIGGLFTGKGLRDYFGPDKQDFVGARWIINKQDKAKKIAGYATAFLLALQESLK